jgi:ribonuclease HI
MTADPGAAGARRAAGKRRRGPALVAHIDGGARGNPGPAGYGVHVEDAHGSPVAELYGYLGVATNNTAEYAGLLAALEYARDAQVASLRVMSDSELLVRQLEGRYRVKDPKMQVLHAAARRLIAGLKEFRVEHVRREENREADRLANLAMDRRDSSGSLPAALGDLPGVQGQLPHLP